MNGCGVGHIVDSSIPTTTAMGQLQGRIVGGQQPIVGSHVYLYAAGENGYGQASVSLLKASDQPPFPTHFDEAQNFYVTTDAGGNFTLSDRYTCNPGTQVYILATGGNAGVGPTPANPNGLNSAIALMSVLGECPQSGTFAQTVPFVHVNEITTVAAAYSLAGFATDATHVASSGSMLGKRGIATAFANAHRIASISTGTPLSVIPAGTATVPFSEINTLANILAACVNTGDATYAINAITHSDSCSQLFGWTTSDGKNNGSPAGDTVSAILNIAHNPGAHIQELFSLSGGIAAPFQPNLAQYPTDFTISIAFPAVGLLSNVSHIAVDGNGSVWMTSGYSSLVKVSSAGTILSGSAGFTGGGLYLPEQIAIDTADSLWAANYTGVVSKFSSDGVALSGPSGFSGGGLQPSYVLTGIAIDPSGNVWIPSNGLFVLSNSGTPISPSGGLNDGGKYGGEISIDGAGNLWLANANDNAIHKFSALGARLSPANGFTGVLVDSPQRIAIDHEGHVWTTSLYHWAHLTELDGSGGVISPPSGYTYGTLSPTELSLDGDGNVWTISNHYPSCYCLAEISNAGVLKSPDAGFQRSDMPHPSGIAIDGSGDVWITNTQSPAQTGLFEFIGLASPVVTPIAMGVATNTVASRP